MNAQTLISRINKSSYTRFNRNFEGSVLKTLKSLPARILNSTTDKVALQNSCKSNDLETVLNLFDLNNKEVFNELYFAFVDADYNEANMFFNKSENNYTYLIVTFGDKETAKLEGAKFDFETKNWYVIGENNTNFKAK